MNINYLPQDMIKDFTRNEQVKPKVKTSVGFALTELEDIFKEDFPYEELPSTTGTKYLWTEAFIYKCLWVFMTDNEDDMGEQEQYWFNKFVEYEEKMSYSITNGGSSTLAISNKGAMVLNHGKQVGSEAYGCTNPDSAGNSYELVKGHVLLGSKCILFPTPVEDIDILESLDKLFVDMYMDIPNNREALPSGELIDLTNSLNDRIKDLQDVE